MAANPTNDLVESVVAEASRLQEFLTSLDARTWASDSTSEGWTIEDVVAHLAGSAGGWATNTGLTTGSYPVRFGCSPLNHQRTTPE